MQHGNGAAADAAAPAIASRLPSLITTVATMRMIVSIVVACVDLVFLLGITRCTKDRVETFFWGSGPQ